MDGGVPLVELLLETAGHMGQVTLELCCPALRRRSQTPYLEFCRYRVTGNMSMSRPGLGLRLEFAEPVTGPLLLGLFSQFG